jgi:large subunit ribosomal protein L10
MKREEKDQIINDLSEKFTQYNIVYVTDTSGLTVEKTNKLRRLCHGKGVTLRVAKNTFIQKAMERSGKEFSSMFEVLKGTSAIMFSETGNVPAKLIKEFRKGSDKPILKGAFIDSAVFVGDTYLDTLTSLKSKEELVADIIFILQSPARNVLSALQSGGGKLAGILKTLSEKKQ